MWCCGIQKKGVSQDPCLVFPWDPFLLSLTQAILGNPRIHSMFKISWKGTCMVQFPWGPHPCWGRAPPRCISSEVAHSPCSINIINSLTHWIELGWNWTLVLCCRPHWDENTLAFIASENVNTIQVKPFTSRVIFPAPVLYFLTHQSVDGLLDESTSWLCNTTGNVGF